jgi:hypothetical protein
VSLPFSLGVSYLVARRAIKKAKAETAAMVNAGEGDSSDEVNGI